MARKTTNRTGKRSNEARAETIRRKAAREFAKKNRRKY